MLQNINTPDSEKKRIQKMLTSCMWYKNGLIFEGFNFQTGTLKVGGAEETTAPPTGEDL